jgi:hypothetical protein
MDWFQVYFDATGFYRSAQPPGGERWSDHVRWEVISRACLEMEGLFGSDTLYVFTRERPESYAIPLAAEGGQALLGELIRRQLLDAELALRAASSEGLFCSGEVA